MYLETAAETARRISEAIAEGLVRSCHDCSEGGLAVALAEMAFSGGLGVEADLRGLPTTDDCIQADRQIFSESNSRYLIEVEPDKYERFAKKMLNLRSDRSARDRQRLIIRNGRQQAVIVRIGNTQQAWQDR